MKIWKINILMLLCASVALPSERPFWTEKTSYDEGDKTYVVGVASSQKSTEEARKVALENAKQELENHFQLFDLKGLTIQTQRTFEEKGENGSVTVFRLMYVLASDVEKIKNQNLDKQREVSQKRVAALNSEVKEKEELINKANSQQQILAKKQSELDQINSNLEKISLKTKKYIRCGLTEEEVRSLVGPPRGTDKCAGKNYHSYGQYWIEYVGGVVTQVIKATNFHGGCGYYQYGCDK